MHNFFLRTDGQIMNGTNIGRWKYANLLVIIQDVNDDPPRFNSVRNWFFHTFQTSCK